MQLFSSLRPWGGFAAGVARGLSIVVTLPILTTAAAASDAATFAEKSEQLLYRTYFSRELRGSGAHHWGEEDVLITKDEIVHARRLARGRDYKLYLTTTFVDHADVFRPIKSEAALVGDVTSFQGFILDVPEGVDMSDYTTIIIWCDFFGEFVTAAQYQ